MTQQPLYKMLDGTHKKQLEAVMLSIQQARRLLYSLGTANDGRRDSCLIGKQALRCVDQSCMESGRATLELRLRGRVSQHSLSVVGD